MTAELSADFQALVDKHQLVQVDVTVTYPPQQITETAEFKPTVA